MTQQGKLIEYSSFKLNSGLLTAIQTLGYVQATPVQEGVISPSLKGQDIIASAKTGSGKTAAFLIPLIEKSLKGKVVESNHAHSLILVPTRELALQIAENVKELCQNVDVSYTAIFGGVKVNPQMQRLRPGVDILIATPGRLLDLHHQGAIKFSKLTTLILDEADRMLDMGFSRDLNKIINLLPQKRQTLLFSATYPENLKELCSKYLTAPVEVMLNLEETTAEEIQHWLIPVDKKQKSPLLKKLILESQWDQVLVFIKSKREANILSGYLEKNGVKSRAIHSDKSQSSRKNALREFKDGKICALIATDLLARGLDIEKLPHVVNFHLPKVPEDYIHRIGRTGRAGEEGEAISLVSASEMDELVKVERQIQQFIERRLDPDFVPFNELPESPPIKELKPKKPKKIKKKEPSSSVPSQNTQTKSIRSVNPWSK